MALQSTRGRYKWGEGRESCCRNKSIKIPRKSPRDVTLSFPKKLSTCATTKRILASGPSGALLSEERKQMTRKRSLFEAVPHHVLGPAPQEGAKHQDYRHDLASPCRLRGLITKEGRNERGYIRAQNKRLFTAKHSSSAAAVTVLTFDLKFSASETV